MSDNLGMSHKIRPYPMLLGLTLVLLGTIAAACGGGGTRAPGQVHVLTWDGIVNPVMERYIDRASTPPSARTLPQWSYALTRRGASTHRCVTLSSA